MVASKSTSGYDNAWLLNEGHWRLLPPGCPNCGDSALAINDRGDVAGEASSLPGFWPRGGEFTQVPVPPGSTGDGFIVGITNHRVMAGNYFSSPGDSERCFRWTAADGSVALGLMGQGDYCNVRAVNDGGLAVGDASTERFGISHAFVFENGAFIDLGTLDGRNTYAFDINRHGHVVFGNYSTAYLWKNGRTIDLTAAYSFYGAVSINDRDEMIGSSAEGHPALLAGGQVIELAPEVANLDDWRLVDANVINNLGMILGDGIRARDGLEHQFMLVPTP